MSINNCSIFLSVNIISEYMGYCMKKPPVGIFAWGVIALGIFAPTLWTTLDKPFHFIQHSCKYIDMFHFRWFSKRRRSDDGIECILRVNCFTDPKPLKKRHNRNGQKKVRKLDSILNKPSMSNDAIRVFFRPCMSAEHPQKYAPKSIPI